MLSENAKIDATPTLEIYNKDVKCGHGASVGQIDKEKLFYMQSRGIDEAEAKNIIIAGFFDPIISEIQDESIKNKLSKIIHEKMGVVY